MQIDTRIEPHLAQIMNWRQHIHSHPELGFEVQETASYVANKLRDFGADEVVEGVGQTGVVGVIKGQSSVSGTIIGLRADMDALPIQEDTKLPYASKVEGRMHACGHDGHTAMLLGAAKALCESRRFDGHVVVIFQPAEEKGGGGREMVQDGMMERFGIQKVFGMHNWPNMPVGQFGLCAGPMMASADVFDVTFHGRGGHAAMPHLCLDTTVAASHVVLALQTIAARRVNPLDSVVVSITSLHTDGDSYNVLPQNVHLRGTVRTLTDNTRNLAEELVKKIVADTAGAQGVDAQINYHRDYPATCNHADETELAAKVASDVAGEENVNSSMLPVMGAEDFSFMLNERPGAFIFIGNGDSAALHHPQYNFNDEVLAVGCSYWLRMVDSTMPI